MPVYGAIVLLLVFVESFDIKEDVSMNSSLIRQASLSNKNETNDVAISSVIKGESFKIRKGFFRVKSCLSL